MISLQEPRVATRVFARVFGPFYMIVAGIAAVRAPNTRTQLADLGVWPWATGAFLLMAGLIVIVFHHHWGSLAAICVSLLGWLMALRGFFALAFPSAFMSITNSLSGANGLWRTFYICVAVFGLYLTYVGWAPAPSQPAPNGENPTEEHPRAD
jgi:hypothetical protein